MDSNPAQPQNLNFSFDLVFEWPWWILPLLAMLAIAVLLVLWVLWRQFRKREIVVTPPPIDLGIDVSRLPAVGPADSNFRLEVYGTPVRVALVVLAPVGREGTLPPSEEISTIVEQIVPGFSEAVRRDQPMLRAWGGQLSSQGFANSFFNHVALPGDRGKGTPWCSLVGKFTAQGKQFLAGLVCCGHGDNALSQYVIQHEGQWNDVLRVRR